MHLESGMEKSGMPTPRPNTVMETMRPVVSLGPTRYIKTKSLRILVVDDELHIRELFADIFGAAGYDVVLAENAEKGRFARPVLLSSRTRSSTIAWARWRASRAARSSSG